MSWPGLRSAGSTRPLCRRVPAVCRGGRGPCEQPPGCLGTPTGGSVKAGAGSVKASRTVCRWVRGPLQSPSGGSAVTGKERSERGRRVHQAFGHPRECVRVGGAERAGTAGWFPSRAPVRPSGDPSPARGPRTLRPLRPTRRTHPVGQIPCVLASGPRGAPGRWNPWYRKRPTRRAS